jgi:hypothetical protein
VKLLLRRNQKSSGLLGNKITFTLDVRAELTEKEKEDIKKYKMGEIMLYERREMIDKGSGLLGLASRMAFKMINLTLSVDDLTKGKILDAKDIGEMLAIEEQVKEAAQNFKDVLTAATTFGGELVIEY